MLPIQLLLRLYCLGATILRTLLTLFAVVFFGAAGYSQNPAEAGAAFQAQHWDKAASEYRKITAADPNNGDAWYQLGMSLYSADKFDEAGDAFRHAASLRFRPVFSTYNEAAALARAGRTDDALSALEQLPAMGYRGKQQLEQDQVFAALKHMPRFQAVLQALQKNVAPCEDSQMSRQFDFWLGEWDVQTAQGQHVGNSSVQKILGGCVIFENWSGPASQGKSFNAYNQALKKWQQYWVDDSGTTTLYTGDAVGDQMHYLAEAGSQNGQAALRMTFTRLDADRVRQFGESSNDGGKTWTVRYDLFYVRKK